MSIKHVHVHVHTPFYHQMRNDFNLKHLVFFLKRFQISL